MRATLSDLPTRRAALATREPADALAARLRRPVGAGKTTAVRALSDVAPVDTDVPISAGSASTATQERRPPRSDSTTEPGSPRTRSRWPSSRFPGQDRFAHARLRSSSSDTRICCGCAPTARASPTTPTTGCRASPATTIGWRSPVTRCTDDAIDTVRARALPRAWSDTGYRPRVFSRRTPATARASCGRPARHWTSRKRSHETPPLERMAPLRRQNRHRRRTPCSCIRTSPRTGRSGPAW